MEKIPYFVPFVEKKLLQAWTMIDSYCLNDKTDVVSVSVFVTVVVVAFVVALDSNFVNDSLNLMMNY